MIRRDADLYIQSVRLKHFHFLKYVKKLRKTRKVFQFGSRQFFTIFITNFGFLLVLVKKNKKTVMDMLTDKNEVNLPEAPVEREAEHLMEQAKNNLKQQGVNIEGIPFTTDGFMDSAKQRVALSLLIGKIISDNEIQADEERVKAVINLMASSYEDPEDVVKYYMNDPQKLSEVQMMVVEDMVVEHVLEQVKIEETTSSFSDVMNANNAA